jgi:hypothetical protein
VLRVTLNSFVLPQISIDKTYVNFDLDTVYIDYLHSYITKRKIPLVQEPSTAHNRD